MDEKKEAKRETKRESEPQTTEAEELTAPTSNDVGEQTATKADEADE